MATKKKADLEKTLARLDAAIKAVDAPLAKALRPGAKPVALAKLGKVVGVLPPELTRWFAWHDGQTRGGISPSTNEQLLSTTAAADAFRFLTDEGTKFAATWVPIMTNGAGDYIVYDRKTGALVHYWHDDAERPKAAPSLDHWVLDVAKGWEGVAESQKPSDAPEGWTMTTHPKAKDAKKKPPGTAFQFRAPSPQLGKGVFVHLFWKQAADMWFQATNSTIERAWTSISNNLFPFQATPDAGMEYCLKGAPDGALFERHFPKPPFPPKK